jgi:hypothetical protein
MWRDYPGKRFGPRERERKRLRPGEEEDQEKRKIETWMETG